MTIFIEGKKNVSHHSKDPSFSILYFYSWAQVQCMHNKTIRLEGKKGGKNLYT